MASASTPAPAGSFARINEVLRHERAPSDRQEARAVLLEVARRKSGRLPPEWLVDRALCVTDGTDWVTQRAALDALLRRLSFAMRDELGIEERPAAGAVLGRYALAGRAKKDGSRAKTERRPYHVEVYALEPLAASCNCADYLRSSLGLCKHLLVVLEDIALRERKAKGTLPRAGESLARPALCWNPVRDWTGSGDRLRGLRWQGGEPTAEALESVDARAALVAELLERFGGGRGGAEPAALAVLRDERERVERERRGRAAAAAALPELETLRRQLYPYQHEGVERFLARQRLLCADDMGLGKTTQAIAACHALYCSGQVERGLLIVPAALKEQWLREWQATTDRAPLGAVDGRADERARLFEQTQRGFLVMNYEQLLRDLPAVQRFAPSLVVLDEAQRIKNWATKSSAYVMSLEPEWRLVLTGTPLENRLEELATLLDWVDDTALAPKWRLAPWHTAWDTERNAERLGARHLDTLRERLAPCMVRRVRREVLSQLPPRSDTRVPVEMTQPQREEHDARTVPIARLLQTGRRRPLRQPEFLQLMQLLTQQRMISNGMALASFDSVWPVYSQARADEALLASASSPKLSELRRIVHQLVVEQQRKVVVFSQWRRMLRLAEWAVRDVLADAGLSSVFFTGDESQRQRTANVDAFHEEPAVRVMFLSDAGGVGLNLQRAANACINLELPWNPAVLEQRIGRIYRLGQTDPVDVIHLVTEYGIESRIAGLVGNKQALFSGLFDGTTDAVRFDGPSSFTADIERLVEPIEVPEDASGDDAGEATDEIAVEVAPGLGDPAGVEPVPVETVRPDAAPLPSLALAGLFEKLSVTRTPDGGLRIEAPPSAAAELTQLLNQLQNGLAAWLERANGR
ncbi:MAG TPA: DEAD/DEAH box helicase [Polyangiaceae bacterium]|nr:DEAD/DEAH box helicase [Polyangiaceae bacterium]